MFMPDDFDQGMPPLVSRDDSPWGGSNNPDYFSHGPPTPGPNGYQVGQNMTPGTNAYTPFYGPLHRSKSEEDPRRPHLPHIGGDWGTDWDLSRQMRRHSGGMNYDDHPPWAAYDEYGQQVQNLAIPPWQQNYAFDSVNFRPFQDGMPSPYPGTPNSLYKGLKPRKPYNERNLAPKAKHFRPDFSGKAGLSAWLGRVVRKDRIEDEYRDDVPRTLHYLLDHYAHRSLAHRDRLTMSLRYDMRHPVSYISIQLPEAQNRFYNQRDSWQLATAPPTMHMRLVHPLLPWYVDVPAGSPNGVSVGDILETLYNELSIDARSREFWTEDMDRHFRGKIEDAWYSRVWNLVGLQGSQYGIDAQKQYALQNGASADILGAIKRVDWLGRSCIFHGLVRLRGGVWEIKTMDAVDLR